MVCFYVSSITFFLWVIYKFFFELYNRSHLNYCCSIVQLLIFGKWVGLILISPIQPNFTIILPRVDFFFLEKNLEWTLANGFMPKPDLGCAYFNIKLFHKKYFQLETFYRKNCLIVFLVFGSVWFARNIKELTFLHFTSYLLKK